MLFDLAFYRNPHKTWGSRLSRGLYPQSYPQYLWIAEKALMKPVVRPLPQGLNEVFYASGGRTGRALPIDIRFDGNDARCRLCLMTIQKRDVLSRSAAQGNQTGIFPPDLFTQSSCRPVCSEVARFSLKNIFLSQNRNSKHLILNRFFYALKIGNLLNPA